MLLALLSAPNLGFSAPRFALGKGRASSPVLMCTLPTWEDVAGDRIRYRQGQATDTLAIGTKLFSMKMNPLGIFDPSAFLVCESSDGFVIGFGQIRKLADDAAASPSDFDAPPGSAMPEADADDEAWDDFERSLPQEPQGLVLPWSPVFKDLEKRAALQRARRRARVEDAAARATPLCELASLVVEDDWQGRGIGSSLVRRLLERQSATGASLANIYLITLEPTCPFYESLGFRRLDEARQIPRQMAFEVRAGEALSALLGNKLICMRHQGSARP